MYQKLYEYFNERTNIEPDAFGEISRYFKPKKIEKDEFLLFEGEICKFNLFVNSGCIRFYSTNTEGQEQTRYFAFEEKFGIALTSLIEQKPSFEYIQSLEESEVLVISREDFFWLVDKVPDVNLIYRDILEMAYVTSQKRIYGLQGDSALDRLKWLLAYQPDIFTRLSSKVIASYLGVTPFTLSRLKKKLFN